MKLFNIEKTSNRTAINILGIKISHTQKTPAEDFESVHTQRTFSQFGEDLILNLAFTILKNKGIVTDITYLDIGANAPKFINNTYFLYEQGYRGVMIEPNASLCKKIEKERPEDIVLNIGITCQDGVDELPFYEFEEVADGLSSFDEKSAIEAAEMFGDALGGYLTYRTINIKVEKINTVIEKYFNSYSPTFISLDVEGIDFDILNSFDFDKYRPIFWCIETSDTTSPNSLGRKRTSCIDLLLSKNYAVFADTYINTTFIDKDILEKMH